MNLLKSDEIYGNWGTLLLPINRDDSMDYSRLEEKLNPEEFGQLRSRIPSLLGCKVMGGDERWYQDMQQYVPGFSIFMAGHTLATGFRGEAHGAYSNVACLHPQAAQGWYEQMKTELSAALALEKRIQQLMGSYISPLILEENYSPQACDKLLAAMGGWANIGTQLRWPYRSIPEDSVDGLREKACELLPEFFPDKK